MDAAHLANQQQQYVLSCCCFHVLIIIVIVWLCGGLADKHGNKIIIISRRRCDCIGVVVFVQVSPAAQHLRRVTCGAHAGQFVDPNHNPEKDCLLRHSRFYLAFENSRDEEATAAARSAGGVYATEKLWGALKMGSVPASVSSIQFQQHVKLAQVSALVFNVDMLLLLLSLHPPVGAQIVWGPRAAQLRPLLPSPNAAIFADDFDTAEQLAAFVARVRIAYAGIDLGLNVGIAVGAWILGVRVVPWIGECAQNRGCFCHSQRYLTFLFFLCCRLTRTRRCIKLFWTGRWTTSHFNQASSRWWLTGSKE